MKTHCPWQGMLAIVRFNWPLYAAAIMVLIVAVVSFVLFSAFILKLICGIALASVIYFILVSLGVSHLVYDRSDLYRWNWLDRALRGLNLREAIFCHSGFDEASVQLREKFRHAQWLVLDHFDEQQMTEPSIRRARAMFPPLPGTKSSRYDVWPVAAESTDLVLGLLAIHELRSEVERSRWFAEAKRCLRSDGRVILVEHVRDLANFIAFGPGFVHFHSRASWRRCWETAGLRLVDEFRVTPFIRIFILSKS